MMYNNIQNHKKVTPMHGKKRDLNEL